jgi:hypothetical protein
MRAKMAMTLYQVDEEMITAREVGEQLAFAVKESLAVFGNRIGVPVEMTPALIAALAHLTATVNTLSTNVTKWFHDLNKTMNERLNSIERQLANIEARQTNVVAAEHDDPIRVITGPDGQNPPEGLFPNTYLELRAMRPNPCKELLMFYGMPPGPSETRNQRLRKFLGAN